MSTDSTPDTTGISSPAPAIPQAPSSAAWGSRVSRLLRRAYRGALLLVHIGAGWCLALFLAVRRRLLGRPPGGHPGVRWWMGRLCRLLRLRVTSRGAPPQSAVFLVANHVSWLDIPLIGGVAGLAFVSKAEIRTWPIFGWMAAQGGTLFIPRGAGQAAEIARGITASIGAGSSVLVFPEGTTTEGVELRPFYPRLFAAALETAAVVQPVAVRYLCASGPHPTAPFVGDESFPSHLWRVLAEPEIVAEVCFLEPLATPPGDRRAVAVACRQAIADALGFPPRTG